MTESGDKPQHNPLFDIKEKCEQYWNEHKILDEEVHAILGFIHERADEAMVSRNDLLAACEAAEKAIRRDCVWMLKSVGDVRKQLDDVIKKVRDG